MPTEYAGVDTFPATVQIPSDGDERNATRFDPGYEDLADRTFYLRKHTTTLYHQELKQDETADTASGPSLYGDIIGGTSTYEKSTFWVLDISPIVNEDIVEIDFVATVVGGGTTGHALLRLYIIEDYGGGSPVETPLNYTKLWIDHVPLAPNGLNINMHAVIDIANGAAEIGEIPVKTLRIGVEARANSTNNATVTWQGSGSLSAKLYSTLA